MPTFLKIFACTSLVAASCPWAARDSTPAGTVGQAARPPVEQVYVDDTNSYLTSDVGGPIEDQQSLSAAEDGPTLLEDFIFRQKIQHFDHERVYSIRIHQEDC
jgi:catalase